MVRRYALLVGIAILAGFFAGAVFAERTYIYGDCLDSSPCVTYGVLYGEKHFDPIAAAIVFAAVIGGGFIALRHPRFRE